LTCQFYSVGADDKIQVVFNGNVLEEFILTSLPANGRYSISLWDLGFFLGEGERDRLWYFGFTLHLINVSSG
jgi:hypothetical protein